jgi:CubicO group peptidase (beta-lactamase class C family)
MKRLFLALLAALASAAAPDACAQPFADRIPEAEALVTAYHDAGLFDGVVLVAEGDRVLYEGAVGLADRTWAVEHTSGTRFRIASVTKQFTAALVLQLVEEGLVDLDAPITRYLPDYPADPGDRITVHHLLSHTSGVPEGRSLRGEPSIADFLSKFPDLPLLFEPGDSFSYSNPGYWLLGQIIEAETGQSYQDALRDRLLQPLGMDDSGSAPYGVVVDRLAEGYARTAFGFLEEDPFLDGRYIYAGGEMYATARDLFRWTRALHRAEPFRTAATLDLMLAPHVLESERDSTTYAYGYGLFIHESKAGPVLAYQHGGRHGPFVSMVRYLPQSNHTVIVLGNTDGHETRETVNLEAGLSNLLAGLEPAAPQRPIAFEVGAMVEAEGVEAAVARYRQLVGDDRFAFDEDQLNTLGYAYVGRGEFATALRLFELNVEAYPDAPNPHDSLGETLLALGDTARAAASYRRALALDPDYPNADGARSVLAQLPPPGMDDPEE